LMAWARSFETWIMKIPATELKYQRLSYVIEIVRMKELFGAERSDLVPFYHFTIVREGMFTPLVTFIPVCVFATTGPQ
ncbi:hypothetical protein B0H19DRAFT_957594, partial [Mycena capillaripes]